MTFAYDFAAFIGDYNRNGVVDAADYVVWRKNDGTPAGYNTWRANFGTMAGSGSTLNDPATSPSVPEPTSVVLLILAAVTLTPTLSQRARESVPRQSSHPYCFENTASLPYKHEFDRV
ncbi:MAG: hypothetical protein WD229_18185 [Pirellulales bacterium]